MIVPFGCVLLASLLPYTWSWVALRARIVQFGAFDNRLPRPEQARLEGWGHRSVAASANGFESFPLFAAVVLMVAFAGAGSTLVSGLCVGYVVLRLAHGIAYLADQHVLRSLVFVLAQMVCLALFLIAVLALR